MTSRTIKGAKNSMWGIITNITITLLNFVTRTIFIKTLGMDYLGINGLFTNILYVLSFAELGIGNAITFCMYKPAAENDYEKLNFLLKLLKKYYYGIGIFIFLGGCLLIPFLKYIIKDPPQIKESLILIYLLYLAECSSSYFFSYKKSLLTVYQNDYINEIVKLIVNIIKTIIQILTLLFINQYIIYLIIFVMSTIISNIIIVLIVNKRNKFILKSKTKKIPKQEMKKINDNIKGLTMYKLSSVVLNGTDNILISTIIGLNTVGLYSNYSLIISAVSGVAHIFLKGFVSGIGNINATENNAKKEKILHSLLFLTAWVYGFISICLIVLLNSFITIWIGEKYLLNIWVVFAAVLYILVDGMEFASYSYINTLGLFKYSKFASLFSAIINIVLSIILGLKFGLFGIFIATSISRLLTTSWYNIYIVYKHVLKKSSKFYYLKYIKLFLGIMIDLIICYSLVGLIKGNSLLIFVLKIVTVVVLSNLIYIIFYHRTKEFKFLKEKLLLLTRKKLS